MRRAATSLALAAALLAAAGASASPPVGPRALRVVPQVSIRGVMLGMTAEQVQAKLGKPDSSVKRTHPIIGRTRTLRFGLLTVVFDGIKSASQAVTITTTSRKERTARGVGVGSTEAVVEQRVPGAKCVTEYGYRHCFVGVQKAGEIVTDFSISSGGRVVRVSLARVID